MSGIIDTPGARSGVIGSEGGIGYEEGTWTPVAAVGSFSVSSSIYTKIGNLVYVSIWIDSVSDITSSTALTISGLPFTSKSASRSTSMGLVRYLNWGANDNIVFYIGGSASTIQLFKNRDDTTYELATHSILSNTNARLVVDMTYCI